MKSRSLPLRSALKLASVAVAVLFVQGCDGDRDRGGAVRGATDSGRQQVGNEPRPRSVQPDASGQRSADDAPGPSVAAGVGNAPLDPEAGSTEPVPPPPDPAQPPPDEPAPENGGWEALAEVRELERDAQFNEAIQRLRALQPQANTEERRDRFARLLRQLQRERRDAAGLDYALRQLTADQPQARRYARQKLRAAGETGLIYLRKAVREAPPETVEEAVSILLAETDAPAINAYIHRLAKDRNAAVATTLVRALEDSREKLTDEQVARLSEVALESQRGAPPAEAVPGLLGLLADLALQVPDAAWQEACRLVLDDETFARRELVGWLEAAYRQVADGDPAAFDELVDVPDATAKLKQYVRRAAESQEKAVAVWALHEVAEFFRPLDQGLWTEYFAGHKLRNLAKEGKTAKLAISTDSWPYDRRQHLSCRWTGKLRVPRDGTYTFTASVRHGAHVKVDGKTVLEDWGTKPERTIEGTVDLTSGLHGLWIEYYQRGGIGRFTLEWSGPDLPKSVLGGSYLMSSPFPPSKRRGTAPKK